LPLAAVGKAMGLAGGEDPATGWHVELGHEIATPWADPPPAAASKGLGVDASSTV
jgi:hypothetical protein